MTSTFVTYIGCSSGLDVFQKPCRTQSCSRCVQANNPTNSMTIPKRFKTLRLTVAFVALPTLAIANAGSPMMWFGILHSLILNAIIGWTESFIVTKFKVPNRTWLIIIANYVSMFIGLNYIAPHFSTIYGNYDFWGGKTSYGNYGLTGFLAGMLTSFVATLIIELPFFILAVKGKTQRTKIILPFFVANTATNIVMILLYYWIVAGGGHW